jgi:protein SCO1/2
VAAVAPRRPIFPFEERFSSPVLRRLLSFEAWFSSFVVLSLFSLLSSLPLSAQPGFPSPAKDVAYDQRLGEPVPLDLVFNDETGRAVKLSEFFGKKPLLLSLVYYDCPMLCGMATDGLVRSLKAVTYDVGKEFEVLTVSFDPREKPELAAAKKKNVLAAYGRSAAGAGWHFLTGDEANIARLTRAVGFRYVWDAEQKQYAHPTGIVTLTPQGRVSKYFFGIEYASKDIRFGLIEATDERIGSAVDRLLLLCYHYDPKVGRYTPAIVRLMRAAGALTVALVGGLIFVLLRREKKGGKA